MIKIKEILRNNYFLRLLYMITMHWPLFFLSGMLKRDKRLWLITCQNGFVDNSKYFYLYYQDFLKSNHNVRLVWLAHKNEDKETLNKIGFEDVVLKKTIKGIFFSLRAKVYIFSYGMHELFQPLSRNAFIVNLWHGVGIKNLIFKSEVEPSIKKALSQPFSEIVYPSIYTKYDLFLSTSELMTEHFSECFAMNTDSFLISEYPRCRLLLQSKDNVQKHINRYESDNLIELVGKLSSYDNVFIYMPTWRDGKPDFLTEIGIDWKAINTTLSINNYMLILKLHPACEVAGLKSYSNIFLLESSIDVYPILPFTDCLITDYSSVYFDYLLTDKNIALFTFDYQEYMANCRDFAYPYDENMIGYKINNADQLFYFFESFEEINFSEFKSDWVKIKNKFWSKGVKSDELVKKIIASI